MLNKKFFQTSALLLICGSIFSCLPSHKATASTFTCTPTRKGEMKWKEIWQNQHRLSPNQKAPKLQTKTISVSGVPATKTETTYEDFAFKVCWELAKKGIPATQPQPWSAIANGRPAIPDYYCNEQQVPGWQIGCMM